MDITIHYTLHTTYYTLYTTYYTLYTTHYTLIPFFFPLSVFMPTMLIQMVLSSLWGRWPVGISASTHTTL